MKAVTNSRKEILSAEVFEQACMYPQDNAVVYQCLRSSHLKYLYRNRTLILTHILRTNAGIFANLVLIHVLLLMWLAYAYSAHCFISSLI